MAEQTEAGSAVRLGRTRCHVAAPRDCGSGQNFILETGSLGVEPAPVHSVRPMTPHLLSRLEQMSYGF